jgi:uncharacterized protein (DUF433 family)
MTEDIRPRRDPRDAPAYTLKEAAHYLGTPRATLRAWCLGYSYVHEGKRKTLRPVIDIADRKQRMMSFFDLVEAHVLDALRRRHEVSLQKVRKALDYLSRSSARPSRHPLAVQSFATDGLDLFLDEYGRLIDLSREGQLGMKQILMTYLKRVERDELGDAVRLYPFTRKRDLDEPRAVVIDPQVSFGRPVLIGTGIPTAVIADRLKAGDTIDELARDYGRTTGEIEEAIRCELKVA